MKKIIRACISAVLAFIFAAAAAFPAFAYFDQGSVNVTLGTESISLEAGSSGSVTVSFSPSSSSQLPGCGMAECPQICGEKDCLDENGQCTCNGKVYQTYYAYAAVSSSNTSVATASYSNGAVYVDGVSAGSAVITVTASLRQFHSTKATFNVTVTSKAVKTEPETEPVNSEPETSASGGNTSGGSSAGSTGTGGGSSAGSAGTGSTGTGSAGTGSEGTGSTGAGSTGTGSAGTGSTGTGSAGTGSAGTGSTGTGSAGTGSAGTGSAGSGSTGTGNTGTGSTGTGSTGTGSTGTGSAGTGSAGSGSTGTGSTRTGRTSSGGSSSGGVSITPIINPSEIREAETVSVKETEAGEKESASESFDLLAAYNVFESDKGKIVFVPIEEGASGGELFSLLKGQDIYVDFQKKDPSDNVIYTWEFYGKSLTNAYDVNLNLVSGSTPF